MWRPWSNEEDAVEENNVCHNENKVSKKHLCKGAKEIVLNVYNSLKESLATEESKLIEKTSELTAVPFSTVRRIVTLGVVQRKHRKDKGSFRKVEEADYDIIRRKVYQLYEENTPPTSQLLKNKLEDETEVELSIETLRKVIKHMGFKYKKIDKRQILMESSRILALRYDYLKKIKAFREENRFICYLDETWFDTHDTVNKGWTDSTIKCMTDFPHNRGKRIIILCAGSENGWVCEELLSSKNIQHSSLDYHEDMTAELFENWYKMKLLPALPPNSVIVMDNATYHSRQQTKIPTSGSKKEEIQMFLHDNDIYYHEMYKKSELLELLKNKKFEKHYYVDELSKRLGHTVLRLPPYYCVFNPIELIWAQLKRNIRINNKHPKMTNSMINVIKSEIPKINAEKWRDCIDHVKKVEIEYNINMTVNPLIININNPLTSSDDTVNTSSDSECGV